MATNEESIGIIRQFTIASVASGDPVLVGADLVGVAESDTDTDGHVMVNIATNRVWRLSVKGINGGGNSAVAIGDDLYFTQGDTPHLNKKTTGVLFGIALGTVSSGATSTIPVLLVQ